jgi:hypothetical protein
MSSHSSCVKLLSCLGLWMSIFIVPNLSAAADHYVWCGATGSATGTNFTNAMTDLPSRLIRGDTYVVAGSASCSYSPHFFADADSGTLVILVRKAQALIDSGIAGWQASFATVAAEWTEATNPDPEANGGIMWQICTDYYIFDGITGTVDPSLGGPAGFGFKVDTPNKLGTGLIKLSPNGCVAHPDFTDITISHVEVTGGVERYLDATVSSCSFSAPTVTVNLSPTPTWTLVSGDLISAFNSTPTVVNDGSGHSLLGVATTSVTGSPTTSFQFNAPTGYVGNLCTQSLPIATVGLEMSGTPGFYLFNANLYTNIVLSYDYIHDISSVPIGSNGLSNATFTHNYIARNRGTPSQHSNGIVDHAGGGVSSSNVTISYNYFEDIMGTAVISVFNALSGPLVTDSNWNIYGNVFWNTDPTTSVTSQWITCFGTVRQPVACSHWKIYNNTLYNFANNCNGCSARVGWVESDRSSTDIEVYNNLWVRGHNVRPTVSRGTVCYNETAACAATAQIIEDYNHFDGSTGLEPGDVHGQTTTTGPSRLFANVALGNFNLRLDTKNMLNTSSLLAANSTDGEGNTRGAHGRWNAGAFHFTGTGRERPSPPQNLTIIVH